MGGAGVVEERVRFRSGRLELDGVLAYPTDDDPTSAWLLLAPHPHMGGRMDNNVIRHLAHRAAETGRASLRFDYRGVGASRIELPPGESLYAHWEAMEREQRYAELLPDVRAAAGFLASQLPGAGAAVGVGYSLGAILAGMAARQGGLGHLVAIAPPVARVTPTPFRELTLPTLAVAGDRDPFCPRHALERELPDAPGAGPVRWLAGCDHFFRGREEEVFAAVADWLEARGPQSSPASGRLSST